MFFLLAAIANKYFPNGENDYVPNDKMILMRIKLAWSPPPWGNSCLEDAEFSEIIHMSFMIYFLQLIIL
jgi:hypothetical protein